MTSYLLNLFSKTKLILYDIGLQNFKNVTFITRFEVASHAGDFYSADRISCLLRDEIRAPLKTPA